MLGLEKLEAVRIAFLMVGVWWFGFAQITFRRLPEIKGKGISTKLLSQGYKEILFVFKQLRHQGNLLRFLTSFFCYSAGVQTVLYLASTFAKKELLFESGDLIVLVLILQIIAIGGAFLFAKISDIQGNKRSLIYMLIIWTIVCGLAYLVTGKMQFYVIAGLVGLVMGGIQSLSRSTYSKLIPDDSPDTTSYFSFFDVVEKLAIVFGTFSFGLIESMSGGMRNSVLALTIFFLIGLLIMLSVKIQHAIPTN
jgi:UMF1 family MFS transporter